jgi:hypothetical protein
VQQGCHPDSEAFLRAGGPELSQLLQRREGSPGQVKGTEGVLEPAVSSAGVDQECVPDLADVAEALDRGRVEGEKSRAIDPDVVPEGIADDFRGGR